MQAAAEGSKQSCVALISPREARKKTFRALHCKFRPVLPFLALALTQRNT